LVPGLVAFRNQRSIDTATSSWEKPFDCDTTAVAINVLNVYHVGDYRYFARGVKSKSKFFGVGQTFLSAIAPVDRNGRQECLPHGVRA
jgi:hypothetical protein